MRTTKTNLLCDPQMDVPDGFIRLSGDLERDSIVNGPGLRAVLWTQGCRQHCPGCQNPETWNPAEGEETTAEELAEEMRATRYLDGITLSGGDPLLQPSAVIVMADAAHEKGLSVWCYTGWTFEALMQGAAGEEAVEALRHIDVLVDGPFVQEKKNLMLRFRGSSNQRLINVQASLSEGAVVLWQDWQGEKKGMK